MRPVLQPALEILFVALFTVSLLAVFSSGGLNFVAQPPWSGLASIGRATFSDGPWVLPSLLGVILAFYAVLIGQSLTGVSTPVWTRTRNTLGLGAQLISGVVVVLVVLAILATFFDATTAPHLIGIVLVGGTLICLGAGTGTFVFGTTAERIHFATNEIRAAANARNKLSPRISPRSAWLSIAATVFALCVLPTGISLALYSIGFASEAWVAYSAVYSIIGLPAVTVILLLTYALFVVRSSAALSIASWIGVGAYTAFLLGLSIQLATQGSQELAVSGWSLVGVVLFTALTSWATAIRGLTTVQRRWTFGAAVTALANRRLCGTVAKRERLIAELSRRMRGTAGRPSAEVTFRHHRSQASGRFSPPSESTKTSRPRG